MGDDLEARRRDRRCAEIHPGRDDDSNDDRCRHQHNQHRSPTWSLHCIANAARRLLIPTAEKPGSAPATPLSLYAALVLDDGDRRVVAMRASRRTSTASPLEIAEGVRALSKKHAPGLTIFEPRC